MSGFVGKTIPAFLVAVGVACLTCRATAADFPFSSNGDLVGLIVDSQGTPQMGATIELFDRLDHLVSRTTSSLDGRFAFPHLSADTYSVRASLTDFLTATRDHIIVKPGVDSMLQIHLATLLSSVELTYALPSAAMTKDWRYVLRSSPATRPITRLLAASSSANTEPFPRVFSDTHAVVSVAGGDFNLVDSDLHDGDVGTGFALSTNFLQRNQIRIGGSIAQNSAFVPAAIGLTAVYTRGDNGFGSSSPEITVSLSQLSVGPGSGVTVLNSGLATSNAPLRSIAFSLYQALDLGDALKLEYGVTAEAIEGWGRTSRISPFARLTGSLGSLGEVVAAYSDGARPDELRSHQPNARPDDVLPQDDMNNVTDSLSRLPQVSYGNGQLQVQRTRTYELGYQKRAGIGTYAVSSFIDDVSNGRVDVSGDRSLLDSGSLMSDGLCATSVYNIGNFQRRGVLASVDQKLNEAVDLTLAYGRIGGLSTTGTETWTSSGSITNFLEERSHNTATVTFNGKAPRLGTKLTAGYGWMDSSAIIPRHVFTTQNAYVLPGLNVVVRQPLPSLFGMPGRLEISADLRNLLAQGYLPVDVGGGRSLLLVQSPRAIRGGLNFIF